MKKIIKHKKKIIAGILLLALLVFLYWWGGNSPSLRGWSPTSTSQSSDNGHLSAEEKIKLAEEIAESKKEPEPTIEEAKDSPSQSPQTQTGEVPAEIPSEDVQAEQPEEIIAEEAEVIIPNADIIAEEAEVIIASDDIADDDYSSNESNALTCTLSVRCDSIGEYIDWLDEEKVDILPSDGIIYAEKEVDFNEGDTVFDVFVREMKANKIHFEYVNTPGYNSAYIEGIANLYEFDCGELSGWTYKVNGQVPNCGCSQYALNSGDKIEWIYTCTLGY